VEKGAHKSSVAGKRTLRPDRVVSVAGGLGALECGAGCVDWSRGAGAVTIRLSDSAMM
jgi:hypothetical protein